MNLRILVLENDEQTKHGFVEALQSIGCRTIHAVSTPRELLSLVARYQIDAVVVPDKLDEARIRALRALRPEMRIIISRDRNSPPLPEGVAAIISGVVYRNQFPEGVRALFGQESAPGAYEKAREADEDSGTPPDLSEGELKAACREARIGKEIQHVIISRGTDLLSCAGSLQRPLVQRIAAAVDESWDQRSRTAQIQYVRTSATGGSMVLYTRKGPNFRLTLVALPQISIAELRRWSDSLLSAIARHVTGREAAAVVPERGVERGVERGAERGVERRKPAATQVVRPVVSAPKAVQPEVSASPSRQLERISGFFAFVLTRLGYILLVLLGIIVLSYFGLNMARGENFGDAAADAISSSAAYVIRLAGGDLGMTAIASGSILSVPVTEVASLLIPRSIGLLGIAMLLATALGLILGISAAQRRSGRSFSIIVASIIGISVPSFFAAFLLQWLVIMLTRQVGRTLLPVGGFGWDSHLILPALVLAARPFAQITRITYVTIAEVLQQDYVRTARSKGLRKSQITWRHVFRNAAIPILTTVGVSLRFALSSLPIVELFFGWPGIGFSLLKGIGLQDDDLVIALLLFLGVVFLGLNLLLDISYRFIDPRLRQRGEEKGTEEELSPRAMLLGFWNAIVDLARDNPLVNWWQRRTRRRTGRSTDFPSLAAHLRAHDYDADAPAVKSRTSLRAAMRNAPFVVGSVLVVLLLLVILFGPRIAPNSPYATLGLVSVDGQLTPPPFAPNAEFPLGTDALGRGILSLLLAGAQQTLVLSMMVVGARMVVGILAGAVAGWTSGSWLDRLVVGISGVIAAFPTLLFAMILILALGIRKGITPFVIALCFVGWGEIMQFVRGEVMAIRPKPHIESAVAIGARTPRIVSKHILPLMFSSLISIAALEMGAVLMLLGELGFINIFIGGGSLIELPSYTVLYSDVPEWGALLSDVRLLARSYPWTAFYPMAAFFIAILGFNLFGEGLRRLIEEGNLIINRFINRYTIIAAVLVGFGYSYFQANSGPSVFYKRHAAEFDGQNALVNLAALTNPLLEGRALDTGGLTIASEYIANKFDTLGLQAGGQLNTYFQTRSRSYLRVDDRPDLVIHDGGSDLSYRDDYAIFPGQFSAAGQATAPVSFVGIGVPLDGTVVLGRITYSKLERLDFSDRILITLSEREARVLERTARLGVLVVTDDPDKLASQQTIGGLGAFNPAPGLWISTEAANRILNGSGYTVEDLRDRVGKLGAEDVFDIPLNTEVSVAVKGTLVDKVPARNVLGYMPGVSGMQWCTVCLGHRLIVVMTQYDNPPVGPKGEIFQSANDTGSGIAVMLEAIRVMQETDYQPYKSFLFVAYSGEGLDGGVNVSDPDVTRFLQAKTGFTNFELEAVFDIRGLGSNSGDRMLISAGGSLRLTELVERSARLMGVKTRRLDEATDISLIYDEGGSFQQGGQEAPEANLYWEGWDAYQGLPADTVDKISPDSLEQAGRVLALTLMTIGREINY